jgi:hypothetical protein
MSAAQDARDRRRILLEGGPSGAGDSSAADYEGLDATESTSMMK